MKPSPPPPELRCMCENDNQILQKETMKTLASAIVQIEDSCRTLNQHGIIPKDVTMNQKTFDLIMLDMLQLGMMVHNEKWEKSDRKTICGLPITIDDAMQSDTLLVQ